MNLGTLGLASAGVAVWTVAVVAVAAPDKLRAFERDRPLWNGAPAQAAEGTRPAPLPETYPTRFADGQDGTNGGKAVVVPSLSGRDVAELVAAATRARADAENQRLALERVITLVRKSGNADLIRDCEDAVRRISG